MASASASASIQAILDSRPPTTDHITYLTILESHISPEILPTLNDILQDGELTQNIGWDLIQLLLPVQGAEDCLTTIARLGNPREVVLKVTEALQILDLDSLEDGLGKSADTSSTAEPTAVDQFCILTKLLAILLPRIKTQYPSRFLSTSLMAVLSTYRPSNQATLAVISFVHTLSGKKRPSLPGRKSSLNIPALAANNAESAPDPEAQEEDPKEADIQNKLLQSFVTHLLERYINANSLEWAGRLLESFDPAKIVATRPSLGAAFKEDPNLATRDTIAGQLIALSRDLGLSDYKSLFDAISKSDSISPSEEDPEEHHPSSPDDIPLSPIGSLFIITSLIFSSVLFGSKISLPSMTIFPDHAKLVKHFIGVDGPSNIGLEEPGVVDAILSIGLWLEHSNRFVSGPLDDDDFLLLLQSLSLLSANNPSPSLRYAAHVLTSSILHAHPVDRVRMTFISDTLEHCPYETLKGSAVSWLKEEIITAQSRKSENAFSSKVALGAVQPYLFPDTSALGGATDEDVIQELAQAYPFHMAVVNFLIFLNGTQYAEIIPSGMKTVVEEIYLGPLREAQAKAIAALAAGSETELGRDVDTMKFEMEMLGQRIAMVNDS